MTRASMWLLLHTCGLGVELVQCLDGQQLLFALVGHDAVNLASHHQLNSLLDLEFAVPVQGHASLHCGADLIKQAIAHDARHTKMDATRRPGNH